MHTDLLLNALISLAISFLGAMLGLYLANRGFMRKASEDLQRRKADLIQEHIELCKQRDEARVAPYRKIQIDIEPFEKLAMECDLVLRQYGDNPHARASRDKVHAALTAAKAVL